MFSILKRLGGSPEAKLKHARTKFARMLIAQLQRQGETDFLMFDEDHFTIRFQKSKERAIFLHNAFDEYQRADGKEAKAKVLEIITQAYLSQPPLENTTFDSVSDKLVAVVRERCFFEFTVLQLGLQGIHFPETANRRFTENLAICIAVDEPSAMQYVSTEQLEKWGVSFDEAFQQGYRNLFEATNQSFQLVRPGLYVGPWNDCYVPSRLLFLEIIRELEVKGSYVAIAPNRNTMIITGSEDIDGQQTMLDLARAALEDPRPMSPRPLILKAGEWLDYFPQQDTPLFDAYASFRLDAFGRDYAEQKDILEKIHEKTGEDIFVASFLSVEDKETGRKESSSVWSRDILTLLPKTDLIYFYDNTKPEGEKLVCKAKWDAVEKAVGCLMEPQGMYPERYKVGDFLDVTVLKDLDRRPEH